MDRTERFYRIEQMLRERRTVPLREFLDVLGVSRATFVRDLEYLRERLKAPIEWDRELRGYRLGEPDGRTGHELPGLWFNASEIHALLTMRRLLAELQPGLLEPHVRPLLDRLNGLLEQGDRSVGDIEKRVRILQTAQRTAEQRHFQPVATALFERRRLHIGHFNRETGATLSRIVSPQRLTHHRGAWYLDAWCHLRDALRRFAVDAMTTVEALPEPAVDIDPASLDAQLDSGYGIFSGPAGQYARLRFTPQRAQWVSREIWHPHQQTEWLPDGRYQLRIPYSNPTELIMDILKHGPDVEVVEPPELRVAVAERMRRALEQYR
ncbi:YafY family protein [Methylococcus sp. Mc7]|uniref:helix-turn-helix transcriptional regulator n=1 Tax=Methylococcus sp. Mc7 TaxID=2860258 RepID=UPI001C532902|nr:WYL domain-containing protein [Methylococcus sp. Mc7]QXP84795.1 WYL domain-containing protein [Methylococcus sp. Mc7]